MSVVVFDYQMWATRFPDLAPNISQGLAQAYFDEATLYLDNTAASPVCDAAPRALILNLMVAHIALLNRGTAANPASGLVGRVTSASEGSVSVSTDMQMPGTAAWFAQTQPGAAAYAALRGYLTARPVIARQPRFDPAYGYGGVTWRR